MKTLYFIAIVFEPALEQRIRKLKLIARDKFDSARALRSPAHITMVPPFHYPCEQIDELLSIVDSFPMMKSPLTLSAAGHFGNRVIYIECDQHQALRACKQQLDKQLAPFGVTKKEGRFHPHITVAFKDLKPERFNAAWHYFKGHCNLGQSRYYRLALLENKRDGWHILPSVNHSCDN
jgi:2'-5' RNA ligase